MNGLTSLIREIIERLDVLEKNSESLQVQSVLDEYNTLVDIFPIKTTDSLKEVETKIENNSAFKGKLVSFINIILSKILNVILSETVILSFECYLSENVILYFTKVYKMILYLLKLILICLKIKSLTQVTSTDIKKTIRNILHYLITDEMAQDYSWLGQRRKAAFQNLEISKILTRKCFFYSVYLMISVLAFVCSAIKSNQRK